ncbi:hypothetical protein M409DRAFT_24752 [Zasmidium cellare ATCC 36951]|uniref:FAD-binding domain-containing protein n=1 Tax=Zasmidium cellare ATCC 36951 TaxID=1080233 RepID=A0A6A6CCC3_ZASCE|nr:uncharacterized protein M409DRAFT_24752 [Zasmidium cellare ATCC 36951]KAF2164847.1 hypothetical protein M409DRAFT_24752 [Zasmidium cellare ATCC 36951]
MAAKPPFNIAIIGGGLCGISLAIALKARHIPFTIYEARSSFTEIGAGINVGPNGIKSLRAIDPSLGEKVYQLATRNPEPYQDVWMYFKYGADCGEGRRDGETIWTLMAPPTGTMTMHRQEFLAALAGEMGMENARFEKKLVGYEQGDGEVVMRFADGTEERASLMVGCDGIHSRVRALMFGEGNPVSKAHFNHDGAYRAVIPIDKAIEAVGESARYVQCHLGPNGYFIMYPVNGGTNVNCGAWIQKPEPWEREEWLVPDQGKQFQEDMKDWGERVHRVMEYFDPNPIFWAQHSHKVQPDSFQRGRVILIGDGAHAMPPHNGAGASQAAEDAYILSEVLISLVRNGEPSDTDVKAALTAFEDVRRPRVDRAHRSSVNTGPEWYGFHERRLEGPELEEMIKSMHARFDWLWGVDIENEAQKAKDQLKELLAKL